MLKPWLEEKIKNAWLDPRKFKDEKEFSYAYGMAWGFAQAANELLQFINEANSKVDFYKKKERGEIVDKFSIGK